MSTASIKFGGQLIEELSQKIPSSLFALNELIKNAYDAFSPDVTIKITPSEQSITIVDHGSGMGTDEIQSLFHISKSTKSYGLEVEQDGIKRITQGSKGLGFLSAFKFGDKVEWVTCKNGIRSTFSVRKSELVSKDDVSGTEIQIVSEPCSEKGTSITVYANNGEIDELLQDLEDDRVKEKLVATIIDDAFNINIDIENHQGLISTSKLKLFEKECEERQLFYITYDSSENVIEFYHKGEHICALPFSLKRTDYKVDLALIIFSFHGTNSKSVSSLNRRVHDDSIYPLVYVNNNLFNNVVIFDPEVLRKKSSGDTLAQMIGRVCVRSQSKELEFNSDRTNFVENSLTKSLIADLKKLNTEIQTKGAQLKKELKKNKKLPTGKAKPVEGEGDSKPKTATIQLDRQLPAHFYIPSEQIALEDYIFQVKNSLGEEVDKNEIEITINDEQVSNRVLLSIEQPCEKKIRFRYNDESTGLVSAEITLSFEKQISNISGRVQGRSLFTIQSASDYKIKMATASDLIFAIDKVYGGRAKEDCLPIIACSIRSIFEISADKIFKTRSSWFTNFDSNSFTAATKKEVKDKLLKNVAHVILLLRKNARVVTAISDVSGVSYSTLNNLLDIGVFKLAVKTSHIGAHQSTRYLSKPKIESCADACGLFAVICDVLTHLDSNTVSSLNINKVTEADMNASFGSQNE